MTELRDIKWVELNRYLHEIKNIMKTLEIEIQNRRRDKKEYVGLVVLERVIRRYEYANSRLKESIEKQFGKEENKKLTEFENMEFRI